MTDLGATSVFYSSRPALQLGGQDEPMLAEALLGLAVEETTAGLYCCEAAFGNWGAVSGAPGFLYFDRDKFDFGKAMAVTLGDGDTEARVFDGSITCLEARFPQDRTPELVVLAEDRLQDLRMTRRTRVFEDVSDEDVFNEIVAEHGLTADVDVDGPTHRVLTQTNQSDLAFVRERARAVDAEVWLDGTTLHVQARSRRRLADVSLTYGSGLREFVVKADLATQRTSLQVGGWDVASKSDILEEAGESDIASELDGGQSGGSILQSAFGERVERLAHGVPHSSEEATVTAQAHYRRLARRFVCGRAAAEGDGRIRVGARVDLGGLGPLFNGAYYVCRVRHTFEPGVGFRTMFEVERPGLAS